MRGNSPRSRRQRKSVTSSSLLARRWPVGLPVDPYRVGPYNGRSALRGLSEHYLVLAADQGEDHHQVTIAGQLEVATQLLDVDG